MKIRDIFPAWARILQGYRPFLSLEITKSCPLRCPGCYAYLPQHVNGGVPLRELADLRGAELIDRTLELVRLMRPLHLSIVGGEPLVRWREIGEMLPEFHRLGIEVQLVTSAVRPIPAEYANWDNLHLVISVDGLQPEHDKRRSPATYARILENISGHSVTVHCTVTRSFAGVPGYLHEFAKFWSLRDEVRKIWFSMYTPQTSEESEERLLPEDRSAALEQMKSVRHDFPKVYLPDPVLDGYVNPPQSPGECIFAQVTACVSADLASEIAPCQFGGTPACNECGCIASAGLASIGRFRLAGIVPVGSIFNASKKVGHRIAKRRNGQGSENALPPGPDPHRRSRGGGSSASKKAAPTRTANRIHIDSDSSSPR